MFPWWQKCVLLNTNILPPITFTCCLRQWFRLANNSVSVSETTSKSERREYLLTFQHTFPQVSPVNSSIFISQGDLVHRTGEDDVVVFFLSKIANIYVYITKVQNWGTSHLLPISMLSKLFELDKLIEVCCRKNHFVEKDCNISLILGSPIGGMLH